MRSIACVVCSGSLALVLSAGCGGVPPAPGAADGDAARYEASSALSGSPDAVSEGIPLLGSAPALDVPGATGTGPALDAVVAAETSADTRGVDDPGRLLDPHTDVALTR